MGNKNNFFSGITELLILAIINDHDSYAYEIVKHIKEYSDNYLSISQNTIYAVIYKLENEGKISHYSKLVGKRRTRVYYRIEEVVSFCYILIWEKYLKIFIYEIIYKNHIISYNSY